jgi:CMP-N,N'-diacetyllegionaminic acid synthase
LRSLAIIPARGGSKGIIRKNLVKLGGRPLLAWTVSAALEAKLVTDCVLSTDDEEIASVGRELGLTVPFLRPQTLARDDTPMLPVVKHALKQMEELTRHKYDIIVLLQPTSPMRTSKDIDTCINTLMSNRMADSIVSVVGIPHNYSPASAMVLNGDFLKNLNRQDEQKNLRQVKPQFWARNGAAIYAFKRYTLLANNTMYGENILAYEMSLKRSIDIDTEFDLEIAEFLIQRGNKL